ncbi:hypothetical protein L7F22_005459 [Adiantum nelumboides]|nr:hypothetical protein [Adiantum nelumboides]
MAGYLCGCSSSNEASGDSFPVTLPQLLQPHQEKPMFLFCPRRTWIHVMKAWISTMNASKTCMWKSVDSVHNLLATIEAYRSVAGLCVCMYPHRVQKIRQRKEAYLSSDPSEFRYGCAEPWGHQKRRLYVEGKGAQRATAAAAVVAAAAVGAGDGGFVRAVEEVRK